MQDNPRRKAVPVFKRFDTGTVGRGSNSMAVGVLPKLHWRGS